MGRVQIQRQQKSSRQGKRELFRSCQSGALVADGGYEASVNLT